MPGLGTLTERVYRNPLPIDYEADDRAGIEAPRTHPDPYVLAFKGEYYAYATAHRGVSVLHSRDLTRWTSRGYALASPETSYWAPCVCYHHGKFYMYYSSGDTADHFQRLKVAVSDSPLGPFAYEKTLYDYFSIDAHVVKDEDGTLYLIYSVDNYAGTDPERPGTVVLIDRLLDPFTPEGKPRLVVGPTLDEEVSGPNRFGDGRDWHTLEGGFYLKRDGRHYVMYSGNSFEREHYFVGTAMDASARTIGECDFAKVPSAYEYAPLLRKNERVEGPGHHSVAVAPNLVEHWVVYHGRDVDGKSGEGERRRMRMDPLHWAGERMWIPGPTWTERDAPALPAFRELGDGPAGEPDPARWEIASGEWEVRDGELTGSGHLRMKPEWRDVRFEGWQRCSGQMSGCRCGVRIEEQDGESSVQVVVDAGRRELIVLEKQGELEAAAAWIALPTGFDPFAWHRISLDKFGAALSVSLDGCPVYQGRVSFDSCRLGLVTRHSRASFGGIAATRHFETRFRSLADTGGRFRANAPVAVGESGAIVRGRAGSPFELRAVPLWPGAGAAQWDWSLRLQAPGGEAGLRWEAASGGATTELVARTEADGRARVVLREADGKGGFRELASADLGHLQRPADISFFVRWGPRGSETWVNGAKLFASGRWTPADCGASLFARESELCLAAFRMTENE